MEVQHEVDGWLQVANIHGEVGLVPSSFVHILQPGEASPAAVGAAGAALSSAVSTGFEGLPGNFTCNLRLTWPWPVLPPALLQYHLYMELLYHLYLALLRYTLACRYEGSR